MRDERDKPYQKPVPYRASFESRRRFDYGAPYPQSPSIFAMIAVGLQMAFPSYISKETRRKKLFSWRTYSLLRGAREMSPLSQMAFYAGENLWLCCKWTKRKARVGNNGQESLISFPDAYFFDKGLMARVENRLM